jgi:hypothetical protein
MKASTVALVVLGVAGAGAAAYFIIRRHQQTVPAPAPVRPGTATFGQELEGIVAARTGVPIAAIGGAATRAPTWLKVGVLPIAATAAAQKFITHPVDTVKSVGSTVKNAASSVGHAIASIF